MLRAAYNVKSGQCAVFAHATWYMVHAARQICRHLGAITATFFTWLNATYLLCGYGGESGVIDIKSHVSEAWYSKKVSLFLSRLESCLIQVSRRRNPIPTCDGQNDSVGPSFNHPIQS